MKRSRTTYLSTLLFFGALAGSSAAHTTFSSPVEEGTRSDNALRIAHGCDAGPVRVQSVVFPTEFPQLTASDPNVLLFDVSDVVEQLSLAGMLAGIQDRDIFEKQGIKRDANGNAIGIWGARGRLRTSMTGRVPIEITAPTFNPSSCASRLLIEVAVADVCRRRSSQIEAGRVNLWIPDNGSAIAEAGLDAGVEGVGEPAVLAVLRNLETNPLPASCGAGYVVRVTPSPEQIDRDLPIRRFWPVEPHGDDHATPGDGHDHTPPTGGHDHTPTPPTAPPTGHDH